jgi:hypothetical protein
MLVAPPLQSRVVGPYPIRCVWFPDHLPLEGTELIQNFGLLPVANGTRGILLRQ